MDLGQFKFKKSFEQGVQESATNTIGKTSSVTLKKEGNFIRVVKVLHNETVYNVLFNNEEKLKKALKNIGKRK